MNFKLHSEFAPTGDQPTAIEKLSEGLQNGEKYQTLLGVTGSGKTFTIANVVEKVQKPTLVLAHNKTLAAQLFMEFKEFICLKNKRHRKALNTIFPDLFNVFFFLLKMLAR